MSDAGTKSIGADEAKAVAKLLRDLYHKFPLAHSKPAVRDPYEVVDLLRDVDDKDDTILTQSTQVTVHNFASIRVFYDVCCVRFSNFALRMQNFVDN
jgi:hypothetical protein